MTKTTQKSTWLNALIIVTVVAIALGLFAKNTADNQEREICKQILSQAPFSCKDHLSARNSRITTYEDGSSSGPTMILGSDTCAAQAERDSERRSACLRDPTSGGRNR